MNSDKMITNDHYQLARIVKTGIDAQYNENVQPYRLISSNVVYSFLYIFFFFFTQLFEYMSIMDIPVLKTKT